MINDRLPLFWLNCVQSTVRNCGIQVDGYFPNFSPTSDCTLPTLHPDTLYTVQGAVKSVFPYFRMMLSPKTDLKAGVIGGLIIGGSTAAFYILNKRVSGMSGIVHSTLFKLPSFSSLSYVAGLLTSGYVLNSHNPAVFGSESGQQLTDFGLVVAGTLVGFGVRLGNGCTSGHGVCGLGRMSLRSLVAVCTFMGTGVGSAMLLRGSPILYQTGGSAATASLLLTGAGAVVACVTSLIGLRSGFKKEKAVDSITAFVCGSVFGVGLGLSGMTNTAKVSGFLDLQNPGGWDPSLMAVMGGAVVFNAIVFPLVSKISPEHEQAVNLCPRFTVDWKLIAGSALFGIGWGIGGICPGPAIVSFGAARPLALSFLPIMIFGMAVHEVIFEWLPNLIGSKDEKKGR